MISIRRRLTIHLLAVITAVALATNVVLYFRARTLLRRQSDHAMLERATALSHLVAWNEKGQMILEIPGKTLNEFNQPTHPDYFEVWRPDHSVFMTSRGCNGADLTPYPALTENQSWYLTLPDGRMGRATAYRFKPHEEADEEADTQPARVSPPPGEAVLLLASDLGRPNAFLDQLLFWQIAGMVALALLSLLATLLSIRHSLRPLDGLGREADALPADVLDKRFSMENLPAELMPIVRRFNDLLARIENAFQRERRFTSNVAHELRTPITELRTLAEVALAAPQPSPAQPEMEEALAIARQMQTIVETLLTIARTESAPRVLLRPTNVQPVVDAAIKPFLVEAQHRSLKIESIVDEAQGLSEPALLESLLRNLIANAVQYAPPHSAVRVAGSNAHGALYLSVSNLAPALAPEDLPHLTEPFWRKDGVRTAGQHVGLGLAVAQAYAALLNMSLTPSLENGRLTMTLRSTPS